MKIFFATDIHGSERCFRKWLAAAKVYDAQCVVLGGDITGKSLVPLCRGSDDAWEGEVGGRLGLVADHDREPREAARTARAEPGDDPATAQVRRARAGRPAA